MNNQRFEQIVTAQITRCTDVLLAKAKEYAADNDRLHNFRVAAQLQGNTPIQALAGFMAKHIVSVYDMCSSGRDYPEAMWNEKIGDSINYMLLLRALVEERVEELENYADQTPGVLGLHPKECRCEFCMDESPAHTLVCPKCASRFSVTPLPGKQLIHLKCSCGYEWPQDDRAEDTADDAYFRQAPVAPIKCERGQDLPAVWNVCTFCEGSDTCKDRAIKGRPWNKCSDLRPTVKDADSTGNVEAIHKHDPRQAPSCIAWHVVAKYPENFNGWRPIRHE